MRAYVLLLLLAVLSSVSVAYEKPPKDGNMLGINGGYGAYGMLFAPGCADAWSKYTLFDYYFVNMRYAKRWENWQIDATATFYHDIERWHIYIRGDDDNWPYDEENNDNTPPVAQRMMTSMSLSESVFATYLHPNVEVSFGLGWTQPIFVKRGGETNPYIDHLAWGSGFYIYPVFALKAGVMDKVYFGTAMNMYDQGMHTAKVWVGGYPIKTLHLFGGGGFAVPNWINFAGAGNTSTAFIGAEGWVDERVLLTGTFSYNFLDSYAHPSNGLSFNLGVAFTF